MIDLLIRNANIASMDESVGVIRNGAVGITGGRIVWVGLNDESELEATHVVDGEGQWLTPGLIDCHTHLVWAGDRAGECELRQQGVSYQEISSRGGGILSTVRATREAGFDELVLMAMDRLSGFVNEGVTTIDIKSGYGLDLESELRLLRVAREVGLRSGLRVKTGFLGAHTVPPEFIGKPDDYIDYLIESVMPVVASEGLADYVDAFCESVGFSVEQTSRLFEAARGFGLPVRLHADQLSDLGGGGLAARFGALSADHLEYASEGSVAAMGEAGTVAVLLPGAFLTLREERLPPVDLFRKYGVKMSISTDCNPGTSPATYLQLMMNLGVSCFGMSFDEVWRGVTVNAASALGLADEVGRVAVGFIADLCLWPVEELREVPYWMGRAVCPRVWRGGVEVG